MMRWNGRRSKARRQQPNFHGIDPRDSCDAPAIHPATQQTDCQSDPQSANHLRHIRYKPRNTKKLSASQIRDRAAESNCAADAAVICHDRGHAASDSCHRQSAIKHSARLCELPFVANYLVTGLLCRLEQTIADFQWQSPPPRHSNTPRAVFIRCQYESCIGSTPLLFSS